MSAGMSARGTAARVTSDATETDAAGDLPAGPAPCADLPIESRVEALLMVADRPMSDARLADVTGAPAAAVRSAVAELNRRYDAQVCAFRIESVAGGWQVMTRAEFAPLIARVKGAREQGKLTHAALETLAVIAYRQPILRADLEAIRGVACGEVLRGLMERRLIKIVGRAEEVGRPMLYGTTGEFLKQFGIGRLEELPNSKDLRL